MLLFLNEQHKSSLAGTPDEKPMSDVIGRVFDGLNRVRIEVASDYIDIGFVGDYLKDKFELNSGHDASTVL